MPSFDLEQVPDDYLGEQELYLVIMDERRHQIFKTNKQTVNVSIKGLMQPIKVGQTKAVILEKKQRVHFDFEVEHKLKEGYYLIYVYVKSGLLGETSFRVD